MLESRIPDDVVMRHADGELPWPLRIPLRAALLLSPDFGSESVSGGGSRLP